MGSCLSTCEGANDVSLRAKGKPWRKELENETVEALATEANKDKQLASIPGRMCVNGSSSVASIYSQQGKKGTNQDCMIIWEDFGSREDTVFCGVFDGHGPYGHLVARRVRDSLPSTLIGQWQELLSAELATSEGNQTMVPEEENGNKLKNDSDPSKEPQMFAVWKESHLRAFKATDKELRLHPSLDCFCSGTTAVTVVKQGQDLVIANVGDSRAILGTISDDDDLMAIQLTVDLKPNLPQEAERIRQCRGRVFALQDEPEVHRVWLPNDDSPGLAMARAFGDFCLKDFGVIAVPEVTYRHLTDRDRFIVLATDGVWDVLTNQEVVHIVSSAPTRATAAKGVVESAVRAWRRKYPTSKVDDCAVVCFYVDSDILVSHQAKDASDSLRVKDLPATEGFPVGHSDSVKHNGVTNNNSLQEETNILKEERHNSKEVRRTLADCIATDEWSALDGFTRVNSLLSLPRFVKGDKNGEGSKRPRWFP